MNRSRGCVLLILGLSACSGCYSPRWHNGNGARLSHSVDRAVVLDGSLLLQGRISQTVSFTDYGVKVNEVVDDTGKRLAFRGYQIFWMKELRFEASFDAPSDSAKTVSFDLSFVSRSGLQTVRDDLPITRNVERDYRTQMDRWSP